jgi:hypothetical protein
VKAIKFTAVAALLLLIGHSALAKDDLSAGLGAPNMDSITLADIRGDVHFLASDEMVGRETLKPEAALTAAYVRSRMLAAGVQPAGENGGWYQDVKLKYSTWKETPTLTFTHDNEPLELKYAEDFVSTGSDAGVLLEGGEIVFAGYAVKDADRKYNDIEGLDLRGKIALIMRYEPSGWARTGRNPFSRNAYLQTKEALLREAGAVAILMVTGPKSRGASDNRRNLPSPDGGEKSPPLSLDAGADEKASPELPFFHISIDACDRLLGGEGRTAEAQAAFDAAELDKRPDMSGVRINLKAETTFFRGTDVNVAGMIKGELDEWIIFGAHHDHLGYGYFGARDGRRGGIGKIHNGADDNASGVSTVLEIAEALATSGVKPRRSFLFLTFTGEEKGLLGSEWYVAHPLIPHEKTIAMINIDMIGRIKDRKIELDGTACSRMLDRHCKDVAPLFPSLDVMFTDRAPMPASDHWAFFNQGGVPVFFPFGGMNDEMHTAEDDAETINYTDMLTTIKMLYEISWRLSEDPGYPDYIGPVKNAKGPDGKPRDPKANKTTDPSKEVEEDFSAK